MMTEISPTHQAALAYAERGWRVIPIRPGTKIPVVDAWPTRATTDPQQINDWWGPRPEWGVGIVTGQQPDGTYLGVIDVDDNPAAGKHGRETLADLETTYAPLPDSVRQLTPSGGLHLVLRFPHAIRNDAGRRLGPWLDFRGDGGQILAAPTIHPNGQPYAWEHGYAPDEHPVADAPQWLVDLLTEQPKPPRTERTPYSGDPRPGDRFAATITWPQLLEPDGAKHLATRKDGCEYWSRPGTNHTSATLYYGGTDLLKVFSSDWPGLTEGETYTRFGYWAQTRYGGDYKRAALELNKQQTDYDLEQLVAHLKPATLTPPQPDPPTSDEPPTNPLRSSLIHWPTFFTQTHTEEEWLIEPLIAAGRGHALYAPAKAGKSLTVLYAVASWCAGRGALRTPPGPKRRALILDYENSADDIYERLTSFGFTADDLDTLHYAHLPSIPGLDTPDGGTVLVELAVALNVELVVIDTVARAVTGDENDANTYRALYRTVGLGLKQAKIGYVRIDHAGKNLEKGQRGSSAKNDDVDIVAQLIRQDHGWTLTATHRRIAWYPETTHLTLEETDDGTRITTAAASWPPGVAAIAAIYDAAGINRDASRRALTALKKGLGIVAPDRTIAAVARYRKTQHPNPEPRAEPRVATTTEPHAEPHSEPREPKREPADQRPEPRSEPREPRNGASVVHGSPPKGEPVNHAEPNHDPDDHQGLWQ